MSKEMVKAQTNQSKGQPKKIQKCLLKRKPDIFLIELRLSEKPHLAERNPAAYGIHEGVNKTQFRVTS